MFVLAVGVERLVLRPLVNQPDIILFMATFGLTYFLIGLGELIFGGEPKVMITEPALSAERRDRRAKCLGGFVRLQKIDIAAAVIASLMVAALAVFFQKTRIGRALRAVADSHKAALSVGISLEQIWVIVWFAAGLVALATGIMWGARSDVSFALADHRAEGAAGADPRRLHLDPRRHCRRRDHRRRREDRRVLLGAAARLRHRELARLRDRARSSCCSVRKGCSARRIIERI